MKVLATRMAQDRNELEGAGTLWETRYKQSDGYLLVRSPYVHSLYEALGLAELGRQKVVLGVF